uniref:Uncharacterized protein n=1 Tax=mine drainage metagenome TaxID=410659 RepID=E6PZB8_9ZZZZ
MGDDSPQSAPTISVKNDSSEQSPPVKKTARHTHKALAPPVQQAAVPQPEVSAIGQLSTGNPDGPTGEKIEASIDYSEKSLNAITRSLSTQEQRTAAQVREFLKEARQALATGDTDGAGTLAEKAKILLAELHP